MTVELDEALLDGKLDAAHHYEELRGEVARALERFGVAPFRTEHLWPVDLADPYGWDPARVPFYESWPAPSASRRGSTSTSSRSAIT